MLSRSIALTLALAALAAGCVNAPASDLETASADLPADTIVVPDTDEVPGDILLSAATPARTINYGGAFSTVIEHKDNITGFVLEVEWDAVSPASETLSLWVRPSGVGSIGIPPDPSLLTGVSAPLAQADGSSPLRLAIPAETFPEPGEYDVIVRASAEPVGVAANQPFTIHITTFEGLTFDDAYSALGADEEA